MACLNPLSQMTDSIKTNVRPECIILHLITKQLNCIVVQGVRKHFLNGSEEQLRQLFTELQKKKEVAAHALQNNVFHNYPRFISTSKEIQSTRSLPLRHASTAALSCCVCCVCCAACCAHRCERKGMEEDMLEVRNMMTKCGGILKTLEGTQVTSQAKEGRLLLHGVVCRVMLGSS